MGELKLKNNEAIYDLKKIIEKAREDLYKIIETYGRSSNAVVIASQSLDAYINIIMKENVRELICDISLKK